MAELKRFEAGTDTGVLLGFLKAEGAIILENVLTPETADATRTELQPYIDATAPGRDVFSGHKTTRTGALVARSPATCDLIQWPQILALCDGLLGPNCERYQLHLAQVIRIMPGQTAQPIHRDRWAWGTYLSGLEPQLNTIWALSDFTAENGATQVVPCSVDWPDDRRPEPDDIRHAEMKRGSVIIYTGSVFHGGGANVTGADRVGLNLTYTLGWLRQEENQYLSCPPDVAAMLSEELQGLIGYALGSYALGYYTPPLPPGEGPELVPPEHALGRVGRESAFGSDAGLAAISEKVTEGKAS